MPSKTPRNRDPNPLFLDYANAQADLLKAVHEAKQRDSFQTYAALISAYDLLDEKRRALAEYLDKHGAAEREILKYLMQDPEKFYPAHELPDRFGRKPVRPQVLIRLASMGLVENHFEFYRITAVGIKYYEEVFSQNYSFRKWKNTFYKLRRAGLSIETAKAEADRARECVF